MYVNLESSKCGALEKACDVKIERAKVKTQFYFHLEKKEAMERWRSKEENQCREKKGLESVLRKSPLV
jgi:Na+-translocating ferredoxin:NAD+ oxidoreductase RnfC subunit